MVIPNIVIETGALSKEVELSKVIIMRTESEPTTEPNAPPLMPIVELDCNAKKPFGKKSVMVLFSDNTPPLEGVNEKVAEEPILPALRSLLEILKRKLDTRSPMGPDKAPKDELLSMLVTTKMSKVLGLGIDPTTTPERVTDTTDCEATIESVVSITIEVDMKATADPFDPLLIEINGVIL